MKKILFISALFMSMLAFTGCEKDDLPNPGGNKDVENTFNEMYPHATQVEWEKKGDYWIVDFWENGKEMEAKYHKNGAWQQTETDISFTELPEAVQSAFNTGEYKDWRVEDVDKIEHNDGATTFILEVEQQNQEYYLFYASDGTLTKAVKDRF